MSHNKNYSKYSEKKKVDEVVESVDDNKEIVEPVEENNESIENISEEPVVEEAVVEEAVDEPAVIEPTIGFIDGCDRLNVRKESIKDSEVLCILDKLAEVTIDLSNSTEDFYKVMTSEGIEGYCMKKFITIK